MIRWHNGKPLRVWLKGSIWGRWVFTTVMGLVVVTVSVGAPLKRSAVRTSRALPDPQLRIITSDNPPRGRGHLAPGGSSVLLPGMPATLNPDGVVSLVDNSAGVFCTGGLIGNRYVLTSAHCVEAASVYSPDYVSFDTSAGLSSGLLADIFIHPLYDGSLEGGYDIAVIELTVDAPDDAPRYGLYTATDELGRPSVKAGHGRTGHGSTGSTTLDAARRVGLNRYDATSVDFNNAFGMGMAPEAYLLYDFDSGLSDNNAWSQYGVSSDLGFGIDEVNAVSGDSGGPTFIHDGSEWLIAGVTAWGAGLPSDPPDVTPGVTDGSWGEISADTRVSSYADFVQSVLDGTFVRPYRYTYSHGNVRPDLSWDRPDATGVTLSGLGPAAYQAFSFTVDASGDYDIESTQAFDGIMHLYEGLPDPASPFVGLIAGNNDGPDGPGTSLLSAATLAEGVTYTIVTSANEPGDIGTFLNTIIGPGHVVAVPSAGGFAGAFAPDRWQFNTAHAEANVQIDTTPGSITIYGGDDLSEGDVDYTIDAVNDPTTLRFDWTYFSADDPGFDSFGILVNGAYTWLTNGDVLFGSYSVILDAGDDFGFRIHTVDGVKGAGIATIFNIRVGGDFDGDGDVDDRDLAQWQDDFGLSGDSDADGDADSDGADFLDWQRQFTGNLSSFSSQTVVPEPSIGLLLTIGMTIVLARRGVRVGGGMCG